MTKRVAFISDVLHFIGPASAQALLADGLSVYCCDDTFNEERARKEFEAKFEGVKTLSGSAARCVEEVIALEGRIDVLVCNDSYPAAPTPLLESDSASLREALDEMLIPAFEAIKAAVPQMRKQGGGKVICLSSASALRGIPNQTIYATARGAVNTMVMTLGQELARDNIQINALAANYVKSPTYYPDSLTETDKFKDHLKRNVPMNRLADPSEAAAAVSFLASDKSRFMTGSVLPFSGGWVS